MLFRSLSLCSLFMLWSARLLFVCAGPPLFYFCQITSWSCLRRSTRFQVPPPLLLDIVPGLLLVGAPTGLRQRRGCAQWVSFQRPGWGFLSSVPWPSGWTACLMSETCCPRPPPLPLLKSGSVQGSCAVRRVHQRSIQHGAPFC